MLKMIEYFPLVLRLVEAFRTFFSNVLGSSDRKHARIESLATVAKAVPEMGFA